MVAGHNGKREYLMSKFSVCEVKEGSVRSEEEEEEEEETLKSIMHPPSPVR